MKDASKPRARRRGPAPEEAPEGMDGLVSATECTGLSPAAVPDADEAQAYAALYGLPPQQPNDAGKARP